MFKIRLLFFIFLTLICPSLFSNSSLYHIQSVEDIVHIFPKTAADMVSFKEAALEEGTRQLQQVRDNIEEGVSFEVVLAQLDELLTYLQTKLSIAEALTLVAPDNQLREEALQTELNIRNLYTDIFTGETEVYNYLKNSDLPLNCSVEKQAFITDLLFQFESNGQNLSFNDRLKFQKLNKEISSLAQLFSKNIQEDKSHINVKKADLKGVQESIFSHLEEDERGLIQLSCDASLYVNVMNTCESEALRKQYAESRANRAFPTNETVLKDFIDKRDEMAGMLGYPSFAHLRLKSEMSKTPETATSFLNELWLQSAQKESEEFAAIISKLPENIQLNQKGQLNTWDISYSYNSYKQRVLQLDQAIVSEYFPIEETFLGLMNIYQRFFNINITEETIEGLWHEDVKILKISEKNHDILGFILLDLYPRDNKYGHACDVPVVPGPIVNGKKYPALEVVIVNFPKSTSAKPSLLKHRDVETFFHEFGHAIHSIFVRNEVLYFSNINNLKYDFVELPSQLLEEWLWEPEILKIVSSHYQTGEPLPDSLIEKIVSSKNSFSGYYVQSQCYLSFLALNLFSEGRDKNPTHIMRDLSASLLPNYYSLDNGHFHLSFGHLTEYGPTYYGYLWSKVYSLDIFEQIKREGLLNPEVGERYRREILEKGGAVDPNLLLKNFLGREPNQKAFIKSMGL